MFDNESLTKLYILNDDIDTNVNVITKELQ